jgi:hypothetical protein
MITSSPSAKTKEEPSKMKAIVKSNIKQIVLLFLK